MSDRPFKAELLLIVLVPLIVAFLAVKLWEGQASEPLPAQSATAQLSQDSTLTLIKITGDVPEKPAPKPKPRHLGNREFSLALALIMGLAALFGHFFARRWLWYIIIALSLIYTVLGSAFMDIKLTAFFVPNLLLAGVMTLIIQKLFFNPSLIRVRLLLCSILGGGFVAVYFFLLYLFTKQPFGFQGWKSSFWMGAIDLVFIFFGMSMADMIIRRIRYNRIPPGISDNDDEDEDAE